MNYELFFVTMAMPKLLALGNEKKNKLSYSSYMDSHHTTNPNRYIFRLAPKDAYCYSHPSSGKAKRLATCASAVSISTTSPSALVKQQIGAPYK